MADSYTSDFPHVNSTILHCGFYSIISLTLLFCSEIFSDTGPILNGVKNLFAKIQCSNNLSFKAYILIVCSRQILILAKGRELTLRHMWQ